MAWLGVLEPQAVKMVVRWPTRLGFISVRLILASRQTESRHTPLDLELLSTISHDTVAGEDESRFGLACGWLWPRIQPLMAAGSPPATLMDH